MCTINRIVLFISLVSLFMFRNSVYAKCPCDIYADAGTPCVAAHSTVRALFASYTGPLYQVRRTSDTAAKKDIGIISAGGYANTAAQDSFLNGKAGTISIIYDQTSNKNDLKKSPKATWLSNGGNEASATNGQIKVNGHTVYGIYVTGYSSNVAYRNNSTTGLAKNNEAETMYMVVDGKRYSDQCCFDYGNAETSGKDDGNATMEAVYWGTDTTWGGKGDGKGPWIAADLENGVFKGNGGGWKTTTKWPNSKTITANFATVMLKGPAADTFILKGGDAQSGKLTTMWNGTRPNGYSPMKKQGAIILGTGGDGSNGGTGTFYEGAITKNVPPNAIDDSIQANIVAAGYGNSQTVLMVEAFEHKQVASALLHYNLLTSRVTVHYSLQSDKAVNMNVTDLKGRLVCTIVNDVVSAGNHEAVWSVKNVKQGVYIVAMAMDGRNVWAGKIAVEK